MDKNNQRYKRYTPKMDKSKCLGCEDNFYNGNNSLGVKECWHFEKAKMVQKKEVHIDQVPPWDQKPIWVPNCFRRKRYVYVLPDRTC